MGLFYEVGVAAREVLHDLWGSDDVDELVVHQVLLPELPADPKGIDGFTDLKDVVWLWVQLKGDEREVSVEHGPNKACYDQYDGGV